MYLYDIANSGCVKSDIREEPRLPTARCVAGSPGVANEECHLRSCDGFGCDDEVAFILTVLRVEDNDKFAVLCSES